MCGRRREAEMVTGSSRTTSICGRLVILDPVQAVDLWNGEVCMPIAVAMRGYRDGDPLMGGVILTLKLVCRISAIVDLRTVFTKTEGEVIGDLFRGDLPFNQITFTVVSRKWHMLALGMVPNVNGTKTLK
jgi:hypothetical protein